MTFRFRSGTAKLAAGLLVAMTGFGATAQDFPSRPIALVSPYQAGGAADGIARAIAEAAARQLGQPVVVEPKPGAEGLVGAREVSTAPPDGYRLLWGGAGSLMITTALRKTPPFDPVTAFTPIAGTVHFSFFLYVNSDFPARTLREFVDHARANPRTISYATGNNQGLLSMSDLARAEKLDLIRVQYRGEVASATDLVSNRVQATFATTALLNFAKEGKLRVLATTLPERSALLPDVPTLREAGFADVAKFGGGWLGIYGPPGVPRPVVERLNAAFDAAFRDPSVQDRLKQIGLVHTPDTLDAFVRFTKDQRDLYRVTVRELGIPLQD